MKLLNFITNSNIFLAVAAVILTVSTQIQLGLKPEWNSYLLLIFFATLFEYNHHRVNNLLSGKQIKNPEKYLWYFENKKLVFFLFLISIAGFIGAALITKLKVTIALLPFGVLTFFYSIPVSGKKKSFFALREIPFLKIFIIAFVWSASTIILPVIHENIGVLNNAVLMLFTERFLFIFAIAIPFDIRDMEEDRNSGLKTFPVFINPRKALVLSYLALSLSFFISLIHYRAQTDWYIGLAMLISIFITYSFLGVNFLKKWNRFYYELMDGTMIIQGSLVMFFYFLTHH